MSRRLSKAWVQFRREKWLLLLCFVLSFFAWQIIRNNISFPLRIDDIPVEIDVPSGWAVLDKTFDTVDIRLLGSREDIRDLNRGPLRIVIPVPEPQRSDEMVVKLESRYLKGNPTAAKVVGFHPSEIEIRLDRKGSKRLPVKAAQKGSLPEGLEIERVICSPATVQVTGAQQQLDKMENIHTEPIDLQNRVATFKDNARIALPVDGRLRVEPDRVSVEFVLETRSTKVTFENIPVHVMCNPNEQRSFAVRPLTINITVRGLQQRIDEIRASDIRAFVSCTELIETTGYELPVSVDLPEGVSLVQTEPAAVIVEIGNRN